MLQFQFLVITYHHIRNGSFYFAQGNDGNVGLATQFVQFPHVDRVLSPDHEDIV